MTDRYPSHLTFAHDPSADDLKKIVGPDFATSYASFHADDEVLRIAPQRIPFRAMVVFVVLFCGALTAAPFVLPALGVPLPAHLRVGMIYAMIALTWIAIVPTFLGVMWFLKRTADRIGPGAIVDKRTGALELPWIERTVDRADVLRFVHLNGRRRYSGNVSLFGQYGVVFRDGEQFVYAPIASLTTRRVGSTPVQRFAEFYGVRVQRVEGGVMA